jgi:cellobiose phosphorylase
MTLSQNGTKVTGVYGNPSENLEGTISLNKLTGTWSDKLSTGKFEFTMSRDGSAFSGFMYGSEVGIRGRFEWSGDREL